MRPCSAAGVQDRSEQSERMQARVNKGGRGSDGGMHARPAAAEADGNIAAAAAGEGTPRPRAAYALVSVPEPHSLRTAADEAGPAAEPARSGPLAAADVGDAGLSRPLHGDSGSSVSNSARGSLSFSYSQFPDSPSSDTSHASALSHMSWPAGPRTVWDASAPLSRSVTLYTPAQLCGPPSPKPIGMPVAATYVPPTAATGSAPRGFSTMAASAAAESATASSTVDSAAPAVASTSSDAYAVAPRSGESTTARDDISTFSIGLPGPPENHIPDERDQVLTVRLTSAVAPRPRHACAATHALSPRLHL